MANEEGRDMAMPATEMPDFAPADILEAFEELSVPTGYRAELIEGEIIVSPPPDGHHEQVVSRVAKQLYRKSETEVDVAGTKGTITPTGRFIPDLATAPEGHFGDAEPWMPADGLLLVVEVTSGFPERDRDLKRRGYAAAAIPLYLLVDRSRNEVVLYSKPADGEYHGRQQQPLGKGIDLPAPFSFTLDTAQFE